MIEHRQSLRAHVLFVLLMSLIATVTTWATTQQPARASHGACSVSLPGSVNVNEGSSVNIEVTSDCDTFAWDLDDDDEYDDDDGESTTFSAAGKDGVSSYTVKVYGEHTWRECAYDPDAGQVICDDYWEGDWAQTTVNVQNVAPTATFTTPTEIDEGGYVMLTFSGPTDPGPGDLSGLDIYSYSNCNGTWGVPWWTSLTPASCEAADGPTTMSLGGRIRDNDSAVTTYTNEVTVNNVAPTADGLDAPAFVRSGRSFEVTIVNPTDPSQYDTLAFAFNCGSGFGDPSDVASATCEAGPDAAEKLVIGSITDDDGGSSEVDNTVVVDADTPKGSVKINGGDDTTTKREVVLNLNGKDPMPGSGVAKMRFSKNGTDWTKWEGYESTRKWTLSRGDGKKQVFAQFKDRVGRKSAKLKDSIVLK